MGWNRKELKAKAKLVLKKDYWHMLLVAFIFSVLSGNFGTSSTRRFTNSGDASFNLTSEILGILAVLGVLIIVVIIGSIAFRIFITNNIEIGTRRYFLGKAQDINVEIKILGSTFRSENYKNICKTLFFRDLYVFLWGCLFVIPGVIKHYQYAMVPYLLADNPALDTDRAFQLSKEMTNGQKMNMFVLDLSFFGWYLLGILLFGIGIYFVAPYVYATDAELYLRFREDALAVGMISADELRLV